MNDILGSISIIVTIIYAWLTRPPMVLFNDFTLRTSQSHDERPGQFSTRSQSGSLDISRENSP